MRFALVLLLALGFAAPVQAEPAVTLRWLGVAGLSIASGEDVLLHDPFVSRPSLARTIFRRFEPDTAAVGQLLAAGGPAPEVAQADAILIGHSHYDHLGDAAAFATRTGATILGSRTTLSIAEGYGADPAALRLALPGETFSFGPFSVRVVKSRHAGVVFGRVPAPGVVAKPPQAPIHVISFKLGDARGYRVTHEPSGLRFYVLSSASAHRSPLEAPGVAPVDVLVTSIQGRDDDLVRKLLETLRPRIVVPFHFDDFFVGLDAPDPGAPRDPDDLAAFEREVAAVARELGLPVTVRRLGLFEALELTPAGS